MFLRQTPDSIYTWQSHGNSNPSAVEEKAYSYEDFKGYAPFNILSKKKQGGQLTQNNIVKRFKDTFYNKYKIKTHDNINRVLHCS